MFPHSPVSFFLVLVFLSVGISEWICPPHCRCFNDTENLHGIVINCTRQGFLRVPQDIPPDTTTLLLDCNKLDKLTDHSFSGLHRLRSLDLSSNAINAIAENAFVGLGSLRVLNLDGNNLTLSPATFPAGVFRPLQSLQVLYLTQNNNRGRSECQQCQRSPGMCYPQPARSPLLQSGEPMLWKTQEYDDLVDDEAESVRLEQSTYFSRDEQQALMSVGHQQLEASELASETYRDTAEDYPDEALSQLRSLRELHINGLTNKTLGPGFRNLTKLTAIDFIGMPGSCFLETVSLDTLANAPHLQYVNMSECHITNLTADAFANLEDLRVLDLSFNFALGFDTLGHAFESLAKTKIESLYMDSVVPLRDLGTQITKQHLKHLKNLKYLRHLRARFNRIESFEEGALCMGMPPNLTHVFLNANLLQLAPYVNDMRCLESLTVLFIDGYNDFWTPPLKPPDASTSQTRQRRHFTEEHTIQQTKTGSDLLFRGEGREFVLPPNLRVFKARHFGLFYQLRAIPVNSNNSLERMIAGGNHFPVWQGPVTGLEKLRELDLSNSFARKIHPTFFNSFPNLEILDISGNRLREVFWDDGAGVILGGLQSLKSLNMSRNDLGHLPGDILINLTNLEQLNLAVNGMGTFTLTVSHMKNLVHLDLSENQIHTLPKSVRDHLDSVAERLNVTVNMTYNPIACICQNIDFLTWIRDSNVNFGTHQYYYCQLEDGSEKFMTNIWGTIDELEKTCGSYVGIFVAAVASSLAVLVLLVVALVYRFRWKLRYLYYVTRLSFQRERRHHDDGFEYDAFVSFAGEDLEFVDGELKNELEVERGLRLCIHERDFVPGQYIASNIVDSVQRSRRTLVVLTRALLASSWCHYELQMALMEAAETGRDVLLFLLYEHVPSHELPREVLFNIQAASYIEFPHGESDKGPFWDRLADALKR